MNRNWAINNDWELHRFRAVLLFLTLAWVLLASTPAQGEDAKPSLPIEMETRLETHEVYPGDEIVLNIVFRSDIPFTAEMPGRLDLGSFDLKHREVTRNEENGRQIVTHRFVLVAYSPGTPEIPRLPFVLTQNGQQEERQSDLARVTIKSLLEEEAKKMALQQVKDKSAAQNPGQSGATAVDPRSQQAFGPTLTLPAPQGSAPDPNAPAGQQAQPGQPGASEPVQVELKPRDIKGPVTLMEKDYTLLYILGGFLAAVLVALLIWLFFKYRKPAEPEAAPLILDTRPAHIIALERLAALEAAQLIAKRQIKEFHLEISEILREYFERRYNLTDALSLTTEEVSRELDRLYLKDLDGRLVTELLSLGDLVKFAKDEPADEACLDRLTKARMIVERTKEEAKGEA